MRFVMCRKPLPICDTLDIRRECDDFVAGTKGKTERMGRAGKQRVRRPAMPAFGGGKHWRVVDGRECIGEREMDVSGEREPFDGRSSRKKPSTPIGNAVSCVVIGGP